MWSYLPLLFVPPVGDPLGDPTTAAVSRRDEEPTRVVVRSARRDAPHINARVFSNFLEHLGGSVYEALWANIVYNPQFEAERDGRLARWRLVSGASWEEQGVVGRCVGLPQGGEARQQVWPPAYRQLRYRGAVWARTPRSLASIIEIALLKPGSETPLCAATVRSSGTAWQPHRFTMALPADAIARGSEAELRVRAVTSDTEIDMLEIFPADAIGGVDPEVLRIARSLRIELLRWPGGNFVSGYRWKHGVGPIERRPTVPNPAWGGLETHHFGVEEFMEFCRRIGAKPHICINAGDGTPEEAADWVAYCNGSAGTPMGALRARNGHPAPYGVQVWEIGNELYGDWQIGHTNARGNAERYVRFRDALLRADPTIEIIATGKGDQFVEPGIGHDTEWNTAVLEAARSAGGLPDYLSVHPLLPLPPGLASGHGYDEIYRSAMAHPQWWQESCAPSIRALLARYAGERTPKLAITEWGIIIGGRDWWPFPNHNVQSGAVYAALFFHAMLRNADVVELSNITALMHGGCIQKLRGAVLVTPMIHVQRMYGELRPTRALPAEVEGPTYDVPRRGLMPEVKGVPWVDVLALEGPRVKALCVVNRSPDRALGASVDLPWRVTSARIETLAAAPQAFNSVEKPDEVAPVVTSETVVSGRFERTYPPCSVTIVRLR